MSIKKSTPKAPAKPPRRRLTAVDARDGILDAAEAILNAQGPQGLKLADIAKSAGVTNGNVLHHFGAIETVHDALMTRMVNRLVDRVLKITQAPWSEDQRMTLALTELFEAFADKSASRLAAWLVMTDRAKKLDEIASAIGRVLLEIEKHREAELRPDLKFEQVQNFVMLGILNALASGLFGRDLSRLFGAPETAARETALGALLTLANNAVEKARKT